MKRPAQLNTPGPNLDQCLLHGAGINLPHDEIHSEEDDHDNRKREAETDRSALARDVALEHVLKLLPGFIAYQLRVAHAAPIIRNTLRLSKADRCANDFSLVPTCESDRLSEQRKQTREGRQFLRR